MAKELLPDALWLRIARAFLQLGCALISLGFLG